jgi:pimeloyl-ACP methyl ester carboxylesterase
MRRPTALLLAPSLAIALGACAAPADEAGSDEAAVERAAPAPIAFADCPLFSAGFSPTARAECANVDVPLDWAHPEGRRANLFVKRVRGTAPGVHKQMWLLAGGPGGAGDTMESMVGILGDPAIDVYIPDHRGTGRSTYLGCPTSATAGTAACVAELRQTWGEDGLRTFTTSTAARDLAHLVDRTREPGQEVHVYGVSYGTYWAQRYLQLFPKQPTAVTLDSVCQSGLCSLPKMGYWLDRVGKQYMAECAADAFCAAKLGPDPIATIKQAIAVADAGTCAGLAGVNGARLRGMLGAMLRSSKIRNLIPATAYRVLRCSAADVAALTKLRAVMMPTPAAPPAGTPPPAPPPTLYSGTLLLHVALSELVEDPVVTRAELQALMSDAVFATYSPAMLDTYDAWPRYPREELVGKYPDTDVPILLMNGTHDTQTPHAFAEEAAPHYTKPGQTFVSMPGSSHGVLVDSSTSLEGFQTCGLTLLRQFTAAPGAPLDTSCREQVIFSPFEGMPEYASWFFGMTDYFDGEPVTVPPPSRSEADPLVAEVRRVTKEAADEEAIGKP